MSAVVFAAPARGASPPDDDRWTVDVRAFAGFDSGASLSAWLPGRRLRLDAEVAIITGHPYVRPAFLWGGIGAVVPLVRSGPSFVGVRAGYDLEDSLKDDPTWQGSRLAHVPSIGLVARLESVGGSSIEAEAGAEAVSRTTAVICCDSNLPSSSLGARLALKAELALAPRWALFAQLGLRTAAHLLEINVLPIASAGLRARF